MLPQPHFRTRMRTRNPEIAFAIGSLAALAVANWLVGRRVEKAHPPQGSFITVKGVRLHYTDAGVGDPVVLIHGNVVSGTDWDISGVSSFLRRTHRVIVFDRPGSGHSDRPLGKTWSAEEQADLLHAALEELGISNPTVVGHSFGALVAVAYAIRFEEDVKKLILISGYYFPTFRMDALMASIVASPVIGDVLRYTISPMMTLMNMRFLKKAMFWPLKPTPSFDQKFSAGMAARPSQIRANDMDGSTMIPSAASLSPNYETLELPVTIIVGEQDKIVRKSNSERLQRYIPGSALIVVEGAGHMVHHFVPADIASAIL